MKVTPIITISACISALIVGFTSCKESKQTIISPPRSGLPFVTKYLVADQNTQFDHIAVITNSDYGTVVIASDPGSVSGNRFIDPRSGDQLQITEFKKLQVVYGDDQVHATWDGLDESKGPVVYNFCFSELITSVDIVCDKEYKASYPAGSSLNEFFSIVTHDIPALVRTYDKKEHWGETYNYVKGELKKVKAGVLPEKMPLVEWNSINRRLVSLIPLFVTDVLPDNKGEYRFTVTYTFANGVKSSFTTSATNL